MFESPLPWSSASSDFEFGHWSFLRHLSLLRHSYFPPRSPPMKAIRIHAFGDPSVLKFEEVPDPVAGAGQVVVQLKAIGVNPVETYIRKGIYGPRTFPHVLGADGA